MVDNAPEDVKHHPEYFLQEVGKICLDLITTAGLLGLFPLADEIAQIL